MKTTVVLEVVETLVKATVILCEYISASAYYQWCKKQFGKVFQTF